MKTMNFQIQLRIPTGPGQPYALVAVGQVEGEPEEELAVADLTGYPVQDGVLWGAEQGVRPGRDGVLNTPPTQIAMAMLEGALR